jgi:3-methyladenine DNA glycosylase AlkD
MTPEQYVSNLDREMQRHFNPTDAAQMKKYMKGHFPFYGIKAPERSEVMKSYLKTHGLPENWRKVVSICWECEQREMHYVGMEITFRSRKDFKVEDISLFESMIVNKSWWDTIDFIASNIAGHYFFKFPDEVGKTITAWRISDNFWLRRVCILFQLKYKEYTDFKLLQNIIHENKYSDEFFIKKAIGWALRQYAKTSPGDVQAFVTETELKPLSRREALKHFS